MTRSHTLLIVMGMPLFGACMFPKLDTCPDGKICFDETGSVPDTGETGVVTETGETGTTPIDNDGDGFASDEDCNDADATVNPDAAEVAYDAVDNDCDPSTPDDDIDSDGYNLADDCDDANAAAYPGAVETCTDADDLNCDGFKGTDDNDGDSFAACDECDDGNADVYPGAVETCNEVDDDCDGYADDLDPEGASGTTTWYEDADGDGYGDASGLTAEACNQPDGYEAVSTDCDDANANAYPGAAETCTDTVDLNCDGSVGAVDNDSDGWVACEECDDANAAVNPDVAEICNGGTDDDCDGLGDDSDPEGASGTTLWYADADSDGYGNSGSTLSACVAPSGYTADQDDCDDTDADVNPSELETCNTSYDDDCDGDTEDGYNPGIGHRDADGDGYGDATDTVTACTLPTGYITENSDCDDTSAAVNPAATEVCNEIDDDCDELTDDADTGVSGTSAWYRDSDSDTYGDASSTKSMCDQPSGYVADATDCDDASSQAYPGASEVCDSADNDCDGFADDDDPEGPSDPVTWYADADGDSYGTSASTASCVMPSGYAAEAGDCDDGASGINPAATETCDGEDDDCDGSTDEGLLVTSYADADSDGYGDPASTVEECSVPTGYVSDATDCDDGASDINPAATETCDGEDDDCDGTADDGVGTTYYLDADGDGYGDATTASIECSAPSGAVTDATDCDDENDLVNPGELERDGTIWDDDCDGSAFDDGSSHACDVGWLTFTGSENLIVTQFGQSSAEFDDGTVGSWAIAASARGHVASDLGPYSVTWSATGGLDGLDLPAMSVLTGSTTASTCDETLSLGTFSVSPSTKYGWGMTIRNTGPSANTVVLASNGTQFESESIAMNDEEFVCGGFTTGASTTTVTVAICTGTWRGGGNATQMWLGTASY